MEKYHAFYLSIFDACQDNENIILLCFGYIFYIRIIHVMFLTFQHGLEAGSGNMLVQEWYTFSTKIFSSLVNKIPAGIE
jgi:hypothetical protein